MTTKKPKKKVGKPRQIKLREGRGFEDGMVIRFVGKRRPAGWPKNAKTGYVRT